MLLNTSKDKKKGLRDFLHLLRKPLFVLIHGDKVTLHAECLIACMLKRRLGLKEVSLDGQHALLSIPDICGLLCQLLHTQKINKYAYVVMTKYIQFLSTT